MNWNFKPPPLEVGEVIHRMPPRNASTQEHQVRRRAWDARKCWTRGDSWRLPSEEDS